MRIPCLIIHEYRCVVLKEKKNIFVIFQQNFKGNQTNYLYSILQKLDFRILLKILSKNVVSLFVFCFMSLLMFYISSPGFCPIKMNLTGSTGADGDEVIFRSDSMSLPSGIFWHLPALL